MATFFAADIGGSKSELAIFQEVDGKFPRLCQKRYRNAHFSGFEDLLAQFLDEFQHRAKMACIAVAGVVAGDRVQLTNLPWLIDSDSLKKHFGFQRVRLINDLTAVAASLAHLGPNDLADIQTGARDGGEIRGIIAPGTGLGEGLLLLAQGMTFARGSEGGHCDFAPVDDEQAALLAWMLKKQRPVSYEALIAGPGLAHLYYFCKEYHGIPETAEIAVAMAQAEDRIPVIVDGAVRQDGCPLCRRAVELFLTILGSETGNLALKLYARGGMYLGGGILPRLFGKIPFTG
ncbi:MAG: glucokinase, partial [Proteobacteria bacterium]|nr:glucokinase [Pseudomonadota bacterium]